MLKVSLTSEEYEQLHKLRNQTSDPRSERALIIMMSHDGQSVSEIAHSLKRNPHTIRLWIKRFNEGGIAGLERKYSPGRPKTLKIALKTFIEVWMDKSPSDFGYYSSLWTVDLFCDLFKKKTGNSISCDTVERTLRCMGYRYRRGKKSVPISAPSKKEKAERISELIDEIKRFVGQDDAVILALDETHLSTEPNVIKGWVKKNSTPPAHSSQERELHNIWRIEYKGTIYNLEKNQHRKQ